MLFSNLLLATVAAAGYLVQDVYYDNYLLTVMQVGTPPQNVSAIWDTGSPLIWLKGANSTECVETHQCRPEMLFNVSESSSWRYEKPGANWGGHGNWGLETVSLNGNAQDDMQVYVSNDKIFGGWPQLAGIFGQSSDKDSNASYVQRLTAKGDISRSLVSFSMNEVIFHPTPGPTGQVIYGGYDRAKVDGNITTIYHENYGGIGIKLKDLKVDGKPLNDFKRHIVLDTGTPNYRLPFEALLELAKAHGGEQQDTGTIVFECSNDPMMLNFDFGYTQIDIDMNQGNMVTKRDDNWCVWNPWHVYVMKPKDSTILMGVPFMSHAMVIYDHDHQQIHISKVKYTDETDIVEITGDIPGAQEWKPDW